MMKKILFLVSSILLLANLSSCKSEDKNLTLSGLDMKNFSQIIKEKEGKLVVLKNKNGMEVCVTNKGARVVSIMVPDKEGTMRDVVLGFDNIKDYNEIDNNFGATIGRYGNRIGDGILIIDSLTYQLPKNNGNHCLHGGKLGWDSYMFDVDAATENSTTLSIVSPDGDSNFPGKVNASITYTLTDDNALKLQYKATTDKKTVINMTNHSYFNLSGDPSKPATDHILYMAADGFTPVDSTLIPTGEIAPVAGTLMDFTSPKVLAQDINKGDEEIQIKYGKGFDHNWVLNTGCDIHKMAAQLKCPSTGIVMDVYTTEPGIQLYTGNFLDGTVKGKKGIVYDFRASVCLETQHFPDSPNKPNFPSTIVEPGQTYSSCTIYKFSIDK